jgi:protein-S-isoprenylcysteine O-methyltransferase Ste14
MQVVDIVILVGWAVFWLYWIVASLGVKHGQTRWAQFAGFRVGIFLVVLLLLRLKVLKGHGHQEVTHSPLLQGIGLAIFVLGLALAFWARVYIGRNWGMPMTKKADPELVTTGPYHTIRHPIYTGMIVAMAGTAIAVSIYWLIALAVLGAYFIFSAFVEERDLARVFPSTYPAYKRSTKMLIPYVF